MEKVQLSYFCRYYSQTGNINRNRYADNLQ